MGFDITIHPLAAKEVQRFFFSVIRNPGKSRASATLITTESVKRKDIVQIYDQIAAWRTEQVESFPHSYGFALAALAGYLHPYWYMRGEGLMLPSDAHGSVMDLVTSVHATAPNLFP